MFLALREMKKEKLRFIMIILVTALIAYLIYFLSSLAFGLSELNKTAIDYWDTKGIVLAQSANENIYSSFIDEEVVQETQLDLDKAVNVISASIYINQDDQEENFIDLVLMGLDFDKNQAYAPIIEGEKVQSDNQVVLSNSFRDEHPIEIGDTITITTSLIEFKVVGFSEDSNYNAIPVAYVQREMASSDVLVDPDETKQQEELEALLEELKQQQEQMPQDQQIEPQEIEEAPILVSGVLVDETINNQDLEEHELQYLSIQDFIFSIPGYMEQLLTFGLMIIALSFISAIIIGIFMYILTMQKKPIFGILKIQGYQNRTITISVIVQTALLVTTGFLIGFGLTLLTLNFLPPSVPAQISPLLFIVVTIFSIVCSLIGSLFSVRTILKIDPLEAI